MQKSECFIIGVLFVALIITIAEEVVDPQGSPHHEPPRNSPQISAFWTSPYGTTSTATPSPSPEIPSEVNFP